MALPSAAPMTFGHPFATGDFPRYADIRTTVSGVEVPSQIDKKSFWSDGSLRFGIVSLKTPTSGASTASVMVRPNGAQRPPAITALQRAQALITAGYDVKIIFTGGITATVTAQTLLQTVVTTGTINVWLHGDVCTEIRVIQYLTNHFGVTFDIRMYHGGPTLTNVIVHNDRVHYDGTLLNLPVDYTMTYDIRVSNVSIFSGSHKHCQMQQWNKRVWWGGAATAARPLFDFSYWQYNARALEWYDLDLGDQTVQAANTHQSLAGANTAPLGSIINTYFPTTGWRSELGMLPLQHIQYITTQDKDLYKDTLIIGDLSLTIPWHFRDPNTNQPMTIADWPNVYANGQAFYDSSPGWGTFFIGHAIYGHLSSSEYATDKAHRPCCPYLPYLITGDRSLHDTLEYDVSAIQLQRNTIRAAGRGLAEQEEPRGFAWCMRTELYFCYVTHNTKHRKKVEYCFNENLIDHAARYAPYYTRDWSGIYGLDGRVGPWQEHFIIQSMSYGALYGNQTCVSWINYLKNFCWGQIENEHNGYSPYWITGYWLDHPMIPGGSTWADLQAQHLAGGEGLPGELYDTYLTSYTAYALAAGVVTWNATGDVRALRLTAFTGWRAWTVGSWSFNDDGIKAESKFVLTPRLPDGTLLHFRNVLCPTEVGTLNASASINEFIFAFPNGTVNAVGGSNLIFVHEGTNTLNGSPNGSDVLIGGKGTDIIVPGFGDNLIQGGYQGTTRIDFGAATVGHDRIFNFSQARGDRINVLPSLSSGQAAAIIAAATTDANGDAVITLPSGKLVTMGDHAPAALATNWFVLT